MKPYLNPFQTWLVGGGCDHSSALYADCNDCIASGDPEKCVACRYSYCEYCLIPVHTHTGESLFPDLVDHNYAD